MTSIDKNTTTSDDVYVAYCGLYCYECRWYTEGKCLSCKSDPKSKTCLIFQCASKKGLESCLLCDVFYKDCDVWKKGILFKREI
ncbi:MAG: hypothetical protein GTN80_06375 [Nitrososphaeria archaeon]|nr:hypothetical protein [Nitrososphaeria archaeon]NIQ33252.1 hypothetical protein [Nitrososphaeria archaeon]